MNQRGHAGTPNDEAALKWLQKSVAQVPYAGNAVFLLED
jgi:hypothetical protein